MNTILRMTKVTAVSVLLTLGLSAYVPHCPAGMLPWETLYLPNLDDCSTYYQCSNGVPILLPCPEGLYYCPQWEVCDWPSSNCTYNCYGVGGSGNGNEEDEETYYIKEPFDFTSIPPGWNDPPIWYKKIREQGDHCTPDPNGEWIKCVNWCHYRTTQDPSEQIWTGWICGCMSEGPYDRYNCNPNL